ncbi:MAG: DUF2141 domain-containing protein [bacterium]|nr:DUF2141 domain-containing protein [bacterium]
MHRSSASFPGDWDRAERFLKVPIKKRGDQIVEIPKLALGTCAIIVVHDLDGDSRMTKNLIGFPQEPFGTSNNPTFYGPPRFRAAAFTLKPGEQIAVRLVRL